jgi:MiaB-like tRNA modifying enzyme
MPKSVYFETYGCSANQNNTEIMSGLLVKAGYNLAENPEKADFIIINSCIVKGPTENRIKSRINELSRLGKQIIVAGCMSDVRTLELSKLNVKLLGVKNIKLIVNLLESGSKEMFNDKEIKLSTSKISRNPCVSITQISEGCLGDCSYCATKLAKGSLYSFPEQDILASIEHDLTKGAKAKEIWLTSQDNAIYGIDKDKPQLPELLSKIISLPYEFMLRIGMLNPKATSEIKEQLADIINNSKVYKFLHIPVQSGSNKILKAMNRNYTKEDFVELIKFFKQQIPEISIATDIIVGFPGESEEDFKETFSLIEQIKPDFINVSRFWPMQGTEAAEMKQIPAETMGQRAIEILELYKSQLDNQSWIARKEKCLINLKNKRGFFARNPSYKRILVDNAKESDFGKFVDVEVTGTLKNYLAGRIICAAKYK